MEGSESRTMAETVASQSISGGSAAAVSRVSSVVGEEEGRFLPGTLLAGRYRIIALLGRGGMGEVYRATDLTLGQSVALKFLPPEASRDQRLLERFHGEVRVARLVSHPNVCRVYDIGEVEGAPFISMEYVDGEDLASLLTRIGRLPADKALETARRLCAGLAAAHDRGIIHRDLKPQNIMINKRGEAVIMDFGLAALAGELSGPEARNGTPAYMSPEQLKGTNVTVKSDLYALGLVIYELFTGKRPFEASSIRQLIDMQESAHLTSMTSIAAEIDPAVEKVIRRCLDPDAERRPANALAVAAALPGGDQLAAALAAGETPSPEMVASAGEVEGLPRRYSVPCLVVVLLCLFLAPAARERDSAVPHAGLEASPEVLAHLSRQVAADFGYARKPADSHLSVELRGPLVTYLRSLPSPRKWDEWLAAEAPIRAVYRESLSPLKAEPYGDVDASNPAPISPGMMTIQMDGHGRLLTFSAVPDGNEPAAALVDAAAVFRAAKLDISTFTETTPNEVPTEPSDQVRAWTGKHPQFPDMSLFVEAAWWKGRVTFVRVQYPWSKAATSPAVATSSSGVGAREGILVGLLIGGVIIVPLMARRNWKKQRADRNGAIRVALAKLLLGTVAWLGTMHPVPSLDMLELGFSSLGRALSSAFILWLIYLALEPEVRARWPHSIVTWNRLLAGRWLDAQVHSHILIGAAVGSLIWMAAGSIEHWMGPKDVLDADGAFAFLMGTRQWIGTHAVLMGGALASGLIVFLAIFGFRFMLRYDVLAALAMSVLFTMSEGGVVNAANWQVKMAIYISLYAVLGFVLLRFGLVATMATVYFINAFNGIMLGGSWRAWYTGPGLATLLLLVSIAVFAFWRSLGTRDLISGDEG
jgi:serine/threonine-protein kinase